MSLRRCAGFSLLEATLAVVIAALALPATLAALGRASELAVVALEQQRALDECWNLVQEIRSREFDAIDTYDGITRPIPRSKGVSRVRVTTVAPENPDRPSSRLTGWKRVDVIAENVPGSISLSALVVDIAAE